MDVTRGVVGRLSLHQMLPGGQDDIHEVVTGSGSSKVIRDLNKTNLCSPGAEATVKSKVNGW